MKGCSYCDTLKELLDEKEIQYTDVDVNSPKGKKEFELVGKIVSTEYVPVIIVNKNILIPETSFRTMEQAANIINDLITKK